MEKRLGIPVLNNGYALLKLFYHYIRLSICSTPFIIIFIVHFLIAAYVIITSLPFRSCSKMTPPSWM